MLCHFAIALSLFVTAVALSLVFTGKSSYCSTVKKENDNHVL
ncbi:MAG: hypothetical protein ACTSXQ_04990 [Alphaproteobacteria bacterium]